MIIEIIISFYVGGFYVNFFIRMMKKNGYIKYETTDKLLRKFDK